MLFVCINQSNTETYGNMKVRDNARAQSLGSQARNCRRLYEALAISLSKNGYLVNILNGGVGSSFESSSSTASRSPFCKRA
jgi:hypothetical protein